MDQSTSTVFTDDEEERYQRSLRERAVPSGLFFSQIATSIVGR
jgi:hypothetical protein